MSRQHMTLIACSNCRKKRTKCDGKTPCGRCKSRDEKCCYESKMWRTKGQLRAEVDSLRAQLRQARAVLGALASKDDYRRVLRKLRKGEAVAAIAKGLPDRAEDAEESPSYAALDSPSPPSVSDSPEPESTEPWEPLSDPPASPESPCKESAPEDDAQPTGLWPSPSQICLDTPDDETEFSSKTSFCLSPTTDVFSSHNGFSASTPATTADFSRRSSSLYSLPEWVDNTTKAGNWTTVTNDDYLIRQLLSFYFSWEHPVLALFSKEAFQSDFDDGRQRYCSSALVNAVCAVACRFIDFAAGIAAPEGLADRFYEEARRLIALEEDKARLTCIQATGLLSLREAAQGRETESRQLAKECAELAALAERRGVKDENDDEEYKRVKATTICGALSLYRMLSLVTASSAFLPMNMAPDGTIRAGFPEDTPLHVSDDLQDAFTRQLPHCDRTSRLVFELTDLVYTSLSELFVRKRPVRGEDLMAAYTIYLAWYDSTFQALRPEVACTPAALFLHIYFQFCLMLLFRPFARLDIIDSDYSTRAVCLEAAQAISTLTASYSRLFTLRRAPCFLPYFVLVATVAQVSPELLPGPQLCGGAAAGSDDALQQVGAQEQLEGSPLATSSPFWASSPIHADGVTALVVGTSQLADMSECHPSAAQGVRALVDLRAAYGMEILQ